MILISVGELVSESHGCLIHCLWSNHLSKINVFRGSSLIFYTSSYIDGSLLLLTSQCFATPCCQWTFQNKQVSMQAHLITKGVQKNTWQKHWSFTFIVENPRWLNQKINKQINKQTLSHSSTTGRQYCVAAMDCKVSGIVDPTSELVYEYKFGECLSCFFFT